MCSIAWRDPAPLFITSPRCAVGFSLQSGLGTAVSALCNPKNEMLFGQIAPVEAIPCSNEVRGSEAYKCKTGTHLLICTTIALKNMKIDL